jgi:hypothetical protein
MVLDEGSFQTRPAKIRRLLADAIYIQATEGDDDVTMEAGPTLLTMHESTELLQADVAGLEASMTHKVDAEMFEAAVASLVAADGTKADQSDLDATNAILATKAAQSDLDATNALVATKATQSDLDATNALLATKAAQSDLDATNALVAANTEANTATQSALNSTDQALAALTVEVAGKQPQLGVGFVQGGFSLLEDGAIKAILGTAPVQVTSTPTHVEVSLGQSYFDAITAIADATAAKQDQLGVGFVQGGHSLLEDGAIKAILCTSPLHATSTPTHVEVSMGQSYYDAFTATDQALAALTAEVAGKQSQLLAGDVAGGTPLLLFADTEASGECTTCPEGTVLAGDTVRALKVSAPLQIQGDSQHVHVTLDASGLASQLDLDGKQDTLTAGSVQGGFSMLDPTTKVVRAIKGVSPVQVAIDTSHVEIFLDQNALGAQSATAEGGLSLVNTQGKIL